MSEILQFLKHGAARITPRVVSNLLTQIPLLKAEFTQINAPKFPHLVDQLEFLADVVEDFAEGADLELPYATVADATFALLYAHRKVDLIPDFVPNLGRADDSSVVRPVLIEHERPLMFYAARHGLNWTAVSTQP